MCLNMSFCGILRGVERRGCAFELQNLSPDEDIEPNRRRNLASDPLILSARQKMLRTDDKA